MPLYNYHHIVDWNTVQEHDPENITLLCASHHQEATNGLLTPEQVRTADGKPFNISRGISSPFGLHFQLDRTGSFDAFIGDNKFVAFGSASFIAVDDIDLVGVCFDSSEHIFLGMNIFDQCNERILAVVQNELIYKSGLWDITFQGKTLTLRECKQHILLEITFLPPKTIKISRGCLLINGVEIIIRPKFIFCGGVLSGNECVNAKVGLMIGRNDRRLGAAFVIDSVPRCSEEQRKRNRNTARQVHL